MGHFKYFFMLILSLQAIDYILCDGDQPVKKIKRIPHLAMELDIDENNKAWVFDHLVSLKNNKLLLDYLFFPPANVNLKNTLRNYIHSMDTEFNTTRWNRVMSDREQFENFKLWKTAKPLIEKSLGRSIYVEKVQAKHIRSMDPNTLHRGECDNNRYNAVFFVVPIWQYNNYGQISFYSMLNSSRVKDGKSRFEVVQTVHPKPLRMVVWPSCVPYLEHPPTVNYYRFLSSIAITFSITKPPAKNVASPNSIEMQEKSFFDFEFTNADVDRKIDYEKHLTRSFYDSTQNHGIFLFDRLFTDGELMQIRQHALEKGVNYVAQFMTGIAEDGDNVGTVSPFSVEGFASCPLWKRVYDLVCHVSGETGWYPYDVALNHIHTTGHTRIHADAEEYQFEYTYLLYLNPNVGANEFGETTWFEKVPNERSDRIHKYTSPGGEEFEPFIAVKPKYGRVVIFRNIIEHSARPLGSQHIGNRYSFAVKVSRSRRIALTKQLYETAENLNLNKSEMAFVDSLIHGNHDEVTKSQVSTERLGEKLKEWQNMLKSDAENNTKDFLLQL